MMRSVGGAGAWRWCVGGLVAVIVMAAACEPAFGQFGGGFRDLTEPGVTSAELGRYPRVLGLDEGQMELVRALHEAYLAEHEGFASSVRSMLDAARQEARETGDRSVWRELRERLPEAREAREELVESYLSDVRLVLTPEQETRWPALLRMRTRLHTMGGQSLLSGENVDVVQLVEDSDLPEEMRGAVDAVLERYAVELDRALKERNALYEEAADGLRDLVRSGDTAALNELYDDARRLAERVRQVNDRYARQVASMLPPDAGSELSSEYRRRSFPRVYRETFADRVFDAAEGLEGLAGELAEEVGALRERYEREVEAVNERLADATIEHERERGAEVVLSRGFGGGSEDQDALTRQKRETGERFIEELRALLGPELSEGLPAREERSWRETRFGGRGG